MTATSLDPLEFPLRGSRLIEASAGTGKTWTIAALYLRLVLGHGGDAAFPRSLTPPEILVVTFTDAATKELRDRIRARLAEAARYFSGGVSLSAVDDFLRDLRAQYPSDAWPACARKLQLAAEWMDEAAVSTIHGWCNRMLREHAFDSDALFTQRLEPDQKELLREVARDYWRAFMYPLDAEAAKEVWEWWKSPAALLDEIERLLPHAKLLAPAAAPVVAIAAAKRETLRQLNPLKAPWLQWCNELRQLFDDSQSKKLFSGQKLNSRNRGNWLDAIKAWAEDPGFAPLVLTDAAWWRLSPEGIAEIWTVGTPPAHPAFAALAALRPQLAALPTARNDILCHAAHEVVKRFAAAQERLAQMGFNELLTRLDAALAGPNGARLAATIRTQFPVAMIDEFQDTDAIQYRIFNAVYQVEDNDQGTAIVLIGDPKQAIYAFRGADIYTYLEARKKTPGRQYTLSCNFRSTHAQVAASNRCFEMAECRAGEGAFQFRRDGDDPVHFVAATANGRQDALTAEGAAVAAMTVWRLPMPENGEPMSKTAYRDVMADICASEMVRLLNLGHDNQAGFAGEDTMRALRPADMAVLVNTGTEANLIRRALADRNVRSVYLSDRDSVFQRPEAFDLQLWLTACAEPDDGRALRAAMATTTLGLGWAALDRLNHEEIAWDDAVLQFRGYRECWRRQGVLPMLRRLLHDFAVPTRLLAQGGSGERSLTDVLHLAELLQQVSTLLDGEHALIRYLAEQRNDENEGGEGSQIRLESDADLVQVITIHKSKGLEYPLVFLPFACAFRAIKAEDHALKWHDGTGALHVELVNDDTVVSRADRERLGEDLRKFYVAVTRARYATWLGVAPVNELERSAFGYLIGGDAQSGVDTLANGHPEITVVDLPSVHSDRFRGVAQLAREGSARVPIRTVPEHWWIASYSALSTEATPVALGSAETPEEDQYREAAAAESVTPPVTPATPLVAVAARPSVGLLHDFPGGASAGLFFHSLLERMADQGFGQVAVDPVWLRETIARRCAVRGWERWIEPLAKWAQHFLQMPLTNQPPFTLAQTSADRVVAEMEFWVAVDEVDLRQLDDLVCRHIQVGADRPALKRGQLNGMLKGFIDLIVEHEGLYYVLDYKSNRLGQDDAAYSVEAMAKDVLSHRYDLQYVLYLLALHRLLRLRLPGYDYDQHIGGAIYLYLRGSQAPGCGLHADRPPRALIEALDRLFTRSSAKEAA